MRRFEGRRALVTGGGDGIGLALAQGLAADGAKVAVLDVRAEAAEAAAGDLPGGLALAADVSRPEHLAAAADLIGGSWGGLDILWINAGVAGPARVVDGSPSLVEWIYGVNVLGAIWTAQAFLPLLREGASPAVGVTVSSAALTPPAGLSLYAASKHATLGVAEALRSDLAEEGIGVTLFCPGLLSTNIWDAGRARPERFGGVRRTDPAVAARWLNAQPPREAVAAALDRMAAGGGYAVWLTEPHTAGVIAQRQAEIAQAIDQRKL